MLIKFDTARLETRTKESDVIVNKGDVSQKYAMKVNCINNTCRLWLSASYYIGTRKIVNYT